MSSQEEKDLILTELSKKQPNRFLLSSAIAKRAHQLKNGARPLINVNLDTFLPVITAIEEMGSGRITIVQKQGRDEDEFLAHEIHQYIQVSDNEPSSEFPDEKKPKKEAKSRSKSKSLGV